MKIYDSETFLKKRLLEETSYSFDLSQKAKKEKLSDREVLCFMLHLFCKMQYMGYRINNLVYKKYFDQNFIRGKRSWYNIKNYEGQGSFICASRLFKDVYCEETKCHLSAYYFALDSKINTNLIFGTINPFNINNGLFHSVCTFKIGSKDYVFDGSNYMIMNKGLYYKIFNFQPLQEISQADILKDRRDLSLKPYIKRAKPYKYVRAKGISNRFYGFGFMVYLYNRDDFLKNNEKQCKNFDRVVSDYAKFKERLASLENKFSIKDLRLTDVLPDEIFK